MKTTNTPDRKMKIKQLLKYQSLALVTSLAVFAALWAMPGTALGQAPTPPPGDLFVSVNLAGSVNNGGCKIYQYTPAGPPPTVFAPNLAAPRGLAFDSAGNLFVATENFDGVNFQGKILKIAADGTVNCFFPTATVCDPTAPAAGFPPNFFPQALAIDNAGNVFVSGSDVNAPNAGAIYEVSPDGNIVLPAPFFGSSPSYPLHSNNTVGLAFDSAGNLFVAANVEQTVYKFPFDTTHGLSSTPTPFVSGAPPFQSGEGPSALTFDASGNLFVSSLFTDSSGEILKFTQNLDGTVSKSIFATGLTNAPKGLAFDSAGNLFLAETGDPGPGDILEFTPCASGCGSVGNIVPASGFSVSYFDQGSVTGDFTGPPPITLYSIVVRNGSLSRPDRTQPHPQARP
jgi:sugar lactone lactonase YvrE